MSVPAAESVVSAAAFRVAAGAGGRRDGDSRIDLTDRLTGGTLTWSAPGGTWRVLVVTSERHDLDYLNRAVVARWRQIERFRAQWAPCHFTYRGFVRQQPGLHHPYWHNTDPSAFVPGSRYALSDLAVSRIGIRSVGIAMHKQQVHAAIVL